MFLLGRQQVFTAPSTLSDRIAAKKLYLGSYRVLTRSGFVAVDAIGAILADDHRATQVLVFAADGR